MISGDIDVTELTGVINNYTNLEGSMMTAGPKGDKGDKGDTGSQGFSPIATVTKSGKIATVTITDSTGTTTCEIRDGEDGQGSGDMLKATYDINDNGIVDNAEKVNNHTVLTDVPANAVFTDTTYTAGTNVSISSGNVISATDTTYTAGTGIDITNGVISNTQTSAEWGNITGTLSSQTDLNTALSGKQETLVSGTNIKTINSTSILGSGDITIQASPEIAIQTTTPTNDEVLWINPSTETVIDGNEIEVITGDIDVDESETGDWFSSNINYPSGFTLNNCVITSLMSKRSGSAYWSTPIGNSEALTYMLGNNCTTATLYSDHITIRAKKLSTSTATYTINVKLTLMKIS